MRTDIYIAFIITVTVIFYLLVLMSGRTGSTRDFYISKQGVQPIARGLGLAADWFCAATLLGFFGLISLDYPTAQWLLVGWLIGLIMLGLLIVPAIFDSGRGCLVGWVTFLFPSKALSYLMIMTLIMISLVLLMLQLKGLGLIFSRHLQVSWVAGIIIASLLLFFYTALSAIKAITRVQMLKYCLLFCALSVSWVYLTSTEQESSQWSFIHALLFQPELTSPSELSGLPRSLQTSSYLSGVELLLTVCVLALGVAVLPYMIKRFQGVSLSSDIKSTAIWMLLFIGVIYTMIPWMATKTDTRLYQVINGPLEQGGAYSRMPNWFFLWEYTGELSWTDYNEDGRVQWRKESPVLERDFVMPDDRMPDNFIALDNRTTPFDRVSGTQNANELKLSEEIKLLLMPELFDMPNWIIAVVIVGVTAAMLATASIVLVSTVNTLVLQSAHLVRVSQHEGVFSQLVAVVLLVIATLMATTLSGGFIEWFNRALSISAVALFPLYVFARLVKKPPSGAIFVGMLVGLVLHLGYILSFDLAIIDQYGLGKYALFLPIPMTFVWLLVNITTVVLLAWIMNAKRLCHKS